MSGFSSKTYSSVGITGLTGIQSTLSDTLGPNYSGSIGVG